MSDVTNNSNRKYTSCLTIKNAYYSIYVNGDQNDKVDYKTFRAICNMFNRLVMKEVLNGKIFRMWYKLSDISIVVVSTNHKRPKIDWNKSLNYKKRLLKEGKPLYDKNTNPNGTKWFIYFTDDNYCKFHWTKINCAVKNKTIFRFFPTRGKKGNKTKLKELLDDPDYYLRFRRLKNRKNEIL